MKVSKQEQDALDIYEKEYQKHLETRKRDVPAFRLAVVRQILELNKKENKKNKE